LFKCTDYESKKLDTHRCSLLSVRYLKLQARTDCATGSTLPLAMSTQSVDRAADSTEVCRSVVSVICEGIGWFDRNRDMVAE